ncbi:type II secretion system protein [Botrimarina sp.]|uniref:type II secretion system protein n=1 Tax=Botrimarina sp. TaxID=2795802 RepID=UPI0032EBD392
MQRRSANAGYSLIELVIVLLVIGVLAGVAAPRLGEASDAAAVEATVQHLKTITVAAEMYRHELGSWPPGALPGQMPEGLDAYLRPDLFAAACPVGGRYDWDGAGTGTVQLKIVGPGADADAFPEIDARIDDGDLSTGVLSTNALGVNERLRMRMQ